MPFSPKQKQQQNRTEKTTTIYLKKKQDYFAFTTNAKNVELEFKKASYVQTRAVFKS